MNNGDGTFEDQSYESGYAVNKDGREIANMGTAEVGLGFIKGGFDLPVLILENRRFADRGLDGIQNCGCPPIDRFRALDILQAVIDHPQDSTVGFMPPVSLGRIHMAQI